jgi:4'-phosphopantetheinyl transferase superfamily
MIHRLQLSHLQLSGAPRGLQVAVAEGADKLRRGLATDELDRLTEALLPGVPLVRLAGGQPVVRGRDDLHLSLSHAAGATALAVAPVPVGVDIEWMDPGLNVLAIGADLFSLRDFAFIEVQDAAGRVEQFYRLWTLKEARLKRSGRTLADSELPEILGADGRQSADMATHFVTLGAKRYCVGVCWGAAAAPSPFLASAN